MTLMTGGKEKGNISISRPSRVFKDSASPVVLILMYLCIYIYIHIFCFSTSQMNQGFLDITFPVVGRFHHSLVGVYGLC